MANTNANKLSASHIRYLLVLKKLAASDLGVRSVELAAELGVSKPSVCNMLCVLAEMKLVDKQPRSIVYLTQAGNQKHYRKKRERPNLGKIRLNDLRSSGVF